MTTTTTTTYSPPCGNRGTPQDPPRPQRNAPARGPSATPRIFPANSSSLPRGSRTPHPPTTGALPSRASVANACMSEWVLVRACHEFCTYLMLNFITFLTGALRSRACRERVCKCKRLRSSVLYALHYFVRKISWPQSSIMYRPVATAPEMLVFFVQERVILSPSLRNLTLAGFGLWEGNLATLVSRLAHRCPLPAAKRL